MQKNDCNDGLWMDFNGDEGERKHGRINTL